MTFEIAVGDRLRAVSVTRKGGCCTSSSTAAR